MSYKPKAGCSEEPHDSWAGEWRLSRFERDCTAQHGGRGCAAAAAARCDWSVVAGEGKGGGAAAGRAGSGPALQQLRDAQRTGPAAGASDWGLADGCAAAQAVATECVCMRGRETVRASGLPPQCCIRRYSSFQSAFGKRRGEARRRVGAGDCAVRRRRPCGGANRRRHRAAPRAVRTRSDQLIRVAECVGGRRGTCRARPELSREEHHAAAMSTREVILDGGSPWGFRMHGGADVGQPLRISRVS
ncbi:uncharacterized protein GBIM_04723 [Gryllus bimaculatus]|nr:uncharacterized protein GBIM_04723 [Gryllus bimaculatus]